MRARSTSCPGSKGPKLDQGCSGRAVTSQYMRAAHAFGGATRIAGSTGCSGAVAFLASLCHCAGTALGSLDGCGGTTGREGGQEQELPLLAGFAQMSLGLRGPRASSGTRANLCCLFHPPARVSSWELLTLPCLWWWCWLGG